MAMDKRSYLEDKTDLAVAVSRFWTNVSPSDDNGCRDWLGTTNAYGYGVFTFLNETWQAHELALTFATGEIKAESLDTCHSCHRPVCCAPSHLRFDTRLANVTDMVDAGRSKCGQWNRRLSDSQVREIRERRVAGATCTELSLIYGIENSYVSMITTGKARKKAPGPLFKPHSRHRRKVAR